MPHKFPTETHLHTWNPSEDAFGRQELAKNVVKNILTKMDTPNVLGIYGDWGTGKTTFLHYLQMVITGKQKNKKEEDVGVDNKELGAFRDSLKKEDPKDGDLDEIEVVHFEPWKYEYAKDTDLLLKLVNKLEDALPMSKKHWKRVKKSIGKIYKNVSLEDFSSGILTSVSIIFSLIPNTYGLQILGLLQKIALAIGLGSSTGLFHRFSLFLKNEESILSQDLFEEIRFLFSQAIQDAIGDEKKKKKLIIFIDDLDRCLPENTIKFLEAIKNFLFQKGVIFVIAVDSRVVAEMVGKKYGLNRAYGYEYLEKIIGYHIDLPKPFLGVDFNTILNNHGILIPGGIDTYISDFINRFIFQPRKAKQVLSQFVMNKYLCDIDSSFAEDTEIQYIFIATYLAFSFPQYFSGNGDQVNINLRAMSGEEPWLSRSSFSQDEESSKKIRAIGSFVMFDKRFSQRSLAGSSPDIKLALEKIKLIT